MMRAIYDTEADALAIDLEEARRADYGDDETPGAIVHMRSGRPISLDVLGPREALEAPLEQVAARHGLDLAALRAAAHSALAAPDRVVLLDVRAPELT